MRRHVRRLRQGGRAQDLDASFGAEVHQAARYETGLAKKALLALVIVAVLITIRLLGI